MLIGLNHRQSLRFLSPKLLNHLLCLVPDLQLNLTLIGTDLILCLLEFEKAFLQQVLLSSQLALGKSTQRVKSGVERVLYLHHLMLDSDVQLGPALVTAVHVAAETDVPAPLSVQVTGFCE